MGLISWFKDKYNNHKFQKAKELLLDGKKNKQLRFSKKFSTVIQMRLLNYFQYTIQILIKEIVTEYRMSQRYMKIIIQ